MTCPYCSPKELKGRIVTENQRFIVLATLGQITDGGYLLIIPKSHTSCLAALAPEHMEELDELRLKSSDAVRREYGVRPIVFEHGIVGQTVKHAHLHILPAAISLTARIMKDFPGCGIGCPPSLAHLQRAYPQPPKPPIPYLFWTDTDGKNWICWSPPAPAQHLRTVAAELLGRPERANWRTMDPKLDKKLYSETVARLKSYF